MAVYYAGGCHISCHNFLLLLHNQPVEVGLLYCRRAGQAAGKCPGADESTPSEVDGANDTGEMQPEKDETESDAEPEITKRAYLTFDDGPSGNTVEILDILDKYDVKATFFCRGARQELL